MRGQAETGGPDREREEMGSGRRGERKKERGDGRQTEKKTLNNCQLRRSH